MSKYGAMVLINGERKLIKRERFITPEIKDFVKSLSDQVVNRTLEMNQAGFQIYRKLGLTPPALNGCHWIFKSAAKFNKIEPWASHKLRVEKGTDPIKLTVEGLKLKSEIKTVKKPAGPKKFLKLKSGQKIPATDITADGVGSLVQRLCMEIKQNQGLTENEAGKELYRKLNIEPPNNGAFWLFKQAAKLNKIEPWFSNKLRVNKTAEQIAQPTSTTATLPTDFVTRIKNLESTIHSLTQSIHGFARLEEEVKDMKVSLDLVMDSISRIHATEGVHVTAENDKEIVLRVPTNLFFKQAQVVEEVKIEQTVKGKKIIIVGPESTQVKAITEKLPGAIISSFTGKDVQERDRLMQKCENADLIVVWPRFSGHWATDCTGKFKEKCMTTRSAGVKTTVDEILERLRWN